MNPQIRQHQSALQSCEVHPVCLHEATEMCVQCRPVFRYKIHDPALNTILPSPTLGADYCAHATLSIPSK